MLYHDPVVQRTASVEQRVDAIQAALDERDLKATEAVEELKQLAQEQGDTHHIGLFRVQRQMDILALCLAHSHFRKWKLEAGAREESPLVPFVQPCRYIRSSRPQPVQQRRMHKFS